MTLSSKKTPLYALHRQLGARMVPFFGWDMPLHYGSQIQEHLSVREDAGCFDVSHMTVLDLTGADVAGFLKTLLANDVSRLTTPGKALYSCMLNSRGGVMDDLIVYWLGDLKYRLITNAATYHNVVPWIQQQAEAFAVQTVHRKDLAMIAVQGPNAMTHLLPLLPAAVRSRIEALPPFQACDFDGWFVARTGYTGEDGVEVLLPAEQAALFWSDLMESGVAPCGLAARDSLRLEAGMNLYGHEMTEETTPFEASLGWTVAMKSPTRDFIGRAALEAWQQLGDRQQEIKGVILGAPGVIRDGMEIQFKEGYLGIVTSGGFSPVLNRGIALARVPKQCSAEAVVTIRHRQLPVHIITPPFVRHGKPCFDLSILNTK